MALRLVLLRQPKRELGLGLELELLLWQASHFGFWYGARGVQELLLILLEEGHRLCKLSHQFNRRNTCDNFG